MLINHLADPLRELSFMGDRTFGLLNMDLAKVLIKVLFPALVR
jgi:hypothetical protein